MTLESPIRAHEGKLGQWLTVQSPLRVIIWNGSISLWFVWFLQVHFSGQPGILAGWTRDPLLLWVCVASATCIPHVSRWNGGVQRILSLKKVVFGVKVGCKNYWGSSSHSLPCPWFSWWRKEAISLNVFLALASKHMGGIQCWFSSLTVANYEALWIPHSGDGCVSGGRNVCQDCQESLRWCGFHR